MSPTPEWTEADQDDSDRHPSEDVPGVRFCDVTGVIVRGPGVGGVCTGSVHFGNTIARCASSIHNRGRSLVVGTDAPDASKTESEFAALRASVVRLAEKSEHEVV